MFLYAFTRPDQMKGHRFTDDVALCRAWTKKRAVKKFARSNLYEGVTIREIKRVRFPKSTRICILTDY